MDKLLDNTNRKVRIAHLVTDEKFIDSAYEWFNTVLPAGNDIFVTTNEETPTHIKEAPYEIVGTECFRNISFLDSLRRYNFVVIHSLTVIAQKVILRCNRDLVFVWVGHGFDYYPLMVKSTNDLLLPLTKQLQTEVRKSTPKSQMTKIIKSLVMQFDGTRLRKVYELRRNRRRAAAIRRISFFSPVLPSEYEMVRACGIGPFPKHVRWNYGHSIRSLRTMTDLNLTGNSILLGNSSTITNNHTEAIEILANCPLSDRKIICPLSYGDAKIAERISLLGQEKWGDQFIALTDFMAAAEYATVVAGCSHVLMNHRRQQGGANVTLALCLGAIVFLRRENPLYHFHKDNGVALYTVEELIQNPSLLEQSLTAEQKDKNRQIVLEVIGQETSLLKTQNFIQTVLAFSNSSNSL
ncbi:4-alpha-L-fucosyltransferase [Novipirellula aureliae]|uniref:4-alpha-L-fucosyltransferase n=1 Tax=Novipirellula aureliae TaxID=2527966 RepID=A0A5C6DRM1_9BACT|nr:TDP-N-acetylfucosamine:lipid II N-acetylfucosaminyltransferase [Novipirellula aureliae]TWU37656.1 4-alpha-L-fucosyltransferase [Novipirellula aureliae]